MDTWAPRYRDSTSTCDLCTPWLVSRVAHASCFILLHPSSFNPHPSTLNLISFPKSRHVHFQSIDDRCVFPMRCKSAMQPPSVQTTDYRLGSSHIHYYCNSRVAAASATFKSKSKSKSTSTSKSKSNPIPSQTQMQTQGLPNLSFQTLPLPRCSAPQCIFWSNARMLECSNAQAL